MLRVIARRLLRPILKSGCPFSRFADTYLRHAEGRWIALYLLYCFILVIPTTVGVLSSKLGGAPGVGASLIKSVYEDCGQYFAEQYEIASTDSVGSYLIEFV